jgi:hypothetical protein
MASKLRTKGRKMLRLVKYVGLILIVAAAITHYPIIPHKLAAGVVWCAQTVTMGASSAIAHTVELAKE